VTGSADDAAKIFNPRQRRASQRGGRLLLREEEKTLLSERERTQINNI
jgi:hypothetical protein